MAISVLVLQDETTRRYAFIMKVCSGPLKKWHGEYNRTLRTASGGVTFWRGQVNGGYVQHINEILAMFRNAEALKDCGFAVTLEQSLNLSLALDMPAEDEFAETFAHMHLSMSGLRGKRHLQNLKGWPNQFIGCKQADNKQNGGQIICNEFLKDFALLSPKQCTYGFLGAFVCGCGLGMDGWMVMFWIGIIEVAVRLGFEIPL